jgi:hypothetical protein
LYFILPEGQLILYTDASDYGIGGYLYQIVDGAERPINFTSKSLSSSQLKYATIQKEALAIYLSIRENDHLLRDRPFTLRTDHANLLFITTNSNAMIQRWWVELQEYTFEKEFTKGINNPIADALSRLCPNLMIEEPDIYTEQDIVCATLEKFILKHDEHTFIATVHNSVVGHHGVERTLTKVLAKLKAQNITWTFPRQKVTRFIRDCPCCQKMSQLKIPIHAAPFSASTLGPMECLNIDFIGPYPDGGYILNIIDTFTRWVELYCVQAADAHNAAVSLLSHFGRFGCPTQLRSDRGSHFVNEVISDLLQLVGVQQQLTLSYSKEENSLVERSNKEVNRHLQALTFDKNTIDEYKLCVPIVQRIINSSYNSRTGISPAQLLFGNSINLDRGLFLPPSERNASVLIKPLSEHTSKMLNLQDTLIKIATSKLQLTDNFRLGNYSSERTNYIPGDMVLVTYHDGIKPTRLHTKHQGPFRVISGHDNVYTILNLVNHKETKRHVSDLRPFVFNPLVTDPQDIARRDYLEFFVEKILDKRGDLRRKTHLEFLVQWVGYDESFNSWEPYSNIRDTDALHSFLTEQNLQILIPRKFKV